MIRHIVSVLLLMVVCCGAAHAEITLEELVGFYTSATQPPTGRQETLELGRTHSSIEDFVLYVEAEAIENDTYQYGVLISFSIEHPDYGMVYTRLIAEPGETFAGVLEPFRYSEAAVSHEVEDWQFLLDAPRMIWASLSWYSPSGEHCAMEINDVQAIVTGTLPRETLDWGHVKALYE